MAFDINDISSLAMPGASNAPAPNMPQVGAGDSAQPEAPDAQQYAPADAASMAARGGYTPPNPAAKPGLDTSANAPAAPGPHSNLMAMISALANSLGTGLSAAGASIGSGGREGGAEYVQKVNATQQRQKEDAAASAAGLKNADLQRQLTQGKITEQNLQNYTLGQTFHDVIDRSHLENTKLGLEVSGAKITQAGEQQQQSRDTANFQASHGGMTSDTFIKEMSSTTPVTAVGTSAAPAPNSFFVKSALATQRAAKTAGIPDDNPAVTDLQDVLKNPNATARDYYMATQQLVGEQERQSKATDEQVKRESAAAGSSVGKLSTPEALAAPGAQAAIQAKINDPNTAVSDIPRLRALLPQAAVAQFNAENIKSREARNAQLLQQGDTETAGRLLANRSLTLAELKTRPGSTPKYVADVILAAQKYDPTYKAAEAEGQAKVAGSEANVQFFRNTDSLLVKNGTLDQLAQAYAALGNTKIPAINKLDNLRAAAVGEGPMAAAYAAQLAVADDWSKVMSGGAGSDSSRQQALDVMSLNLSPAGQTSAIAQLRRGVLSQRNGQVGTNPYLKDMYPDPSTRQETAGQSGTQAAGPAGATGKAYPKGKTSGPQYWHDANGKNLGQVQ